MQKCLLAPLALADRAVNCSSATLRGADLPSKFLAAHPPDRIPTEW